MYEEEEEEEDGGEEGNVYSFQAVNRSKTTGTTTTMLTSRVRTVSRSKSLLSRAKTPGSAHFPLLVFPLVARHCRVLGRLPACPLLTGAYLP